MPTITTLIIGFSLFSAPILLLAYLFFLKDMQKTWLGMASCALLLLVLVGLQVEHLRFLAGGHEPLDSRWYGLLLLCAPIAFYLFSREILMPGAPLRLWHVLHALPVLAVIVLPLEYVAPLAFTIGSGYTIWFARLVYGLRRHVARFRFEMFFFGLFAITAVSVVILVFLLPYLSTALFYTAYANAIGLTLVLIVAALIAFPELLGNISDAARLAYAATTLGSVNVEEKLAALERLMTEERIYQDEDLNLSSLATELGVSSHQLSELINTHFGHSFSRHVREHRVAEARRLLDSDRRASVLSIGMTVGFRSQSNFYAAFREITGESPGAYRKQQE